MFPPLSNPSVWGAWRGQWIWDSAPERGAIWRRAPEGRSHFVYFRRVVSVEAVPPSAWARVTADSRYALSVNGHLVGRGPIRGEPQFLGWDEYDLAPYLRAGRNTIVALCRYYGAAGPWWSPAPLVGTLGRGSFCFETTPDCPVEVVSDESWRVAPAPWLDVAFTSDHGVPTELIDGRLSPHGLHDPETPENGWPSAQRVAGYGHGLVLDRPPAAPYTSPLQRPIPQLTARRRDPRRISTENVQAQLDGDPLASWLSLQRGTGDRQLDVWDMGDMCLGHVALTVNARPDLAGAAVDVVGGESLRADGLPELGSRKWTARYLTGPVNERVEFFDPIGLRYLAVHRPRDVEVQIEMSEAIYPRPDGASFECDDPRYTRMWSIGGRTLDLCSTDSFLDCPGREQRAWLGDAYVEMLVSFVASPDWRLVRHHLGLAARSRGATGLLAMAAACDAAGSGVTIPDYSLHWIRALSAYWRHVGDEALIRELLPVAEGIIGAHERHRGPTGLLEDFPGWVYVDWAQTDRDSTVGAHDGLYAAALEAYRELPGAAPVESLLERTRAGFEALWDEDRHAYVDAIGRRGRSRRVSQHTNIAALLGGLVPAHRVTRLIERIVDPAVTETGGRLVLTATPASVRAAGRVATFQYDRPDDFDEERDVVAAQPFFCRFLHEALFKHGRRDLILDSLLRWHELGAHGTFAELWSAPPGAGSLCHAWSASPTYDLTTYVLGVRPVDPGYTKAIIDPYLGPLRYARGRIPTPLGWLQVSVEGRRVEVDAPPGMAVDLPQA